jgi:hypothetical protein
MTCWIGWFPRFRTAISVMVAVALCGPGEVLGTAFQNLDFESAIIGTPVNHELPASQAVPNWTTSHWHSGYVCYDDLSVGSTVVSLQDGLNPYHWGSVWMNPLQGSCSVLLQSGYNGPPEDAWISQTGDVPPDARSLMFNSDYISGGSLVVSMNGTPISMSVYSVGPIVNSNFGPVKTYIGDISAFSGRQNVALRFEAVPFDPPYCNADLDAIQFSSISTPEPSSLVLLAVGIVSLAGYFW